MLGSSQSLGMLVLELNANASGYFRCFQQVENTTNATMGNVVNTVKNASLVVGAAMAAIGAVSVSEANKFESSFAGVKKTVNATEAEFAQLEAGFRNMAKQIPVNVNELNRIGEAAGQLGIKTSNILSFSRVMADLGVSTNMTSDQAATSLARLANITQMSQNNFDRLGATIVGLGNTMATTESEITEMAMRIAGAGHQVGMTEADILGFAAALSSVGVEAAAGGSSISRIMIAMSKAVAEGGEKLDLFAAVARKSSADFRKGFKEDAAQTIVSFITGLKDTADAGNDVFKVLNRLDIDDIRLTDALLRASGAGDLFGKAIKTANTAWQQNVALTNEAGRRYATFDSQITITLNTVRDIAITVGQQLVPVLKVINLQLQDVAKSFGAANGDAQTFGAFLRDSLIVIIAKVSDVFYGWQLIMKYLQMAMIGVSGAFTVVRDAGELVMLAVAYFLQDAVRKFRLVGAELGGIFFAILDKVQGIVKQLLQKIGVEFEGLDLKGMVAKYEQAISDLKKDAPATGAAYKAALTDFKQFMDDISNGTDRFTMANNSIKAEIDKMLAAGTPSDRIIKNLSQVTTNATAAANALGSLGTDPIPPLDEAAEKLKVMNGLVLELRDVIKQPWEAAIPELQKYKTLLDAGLITQREFNMAITAKGLDAGIASQLQTASEVLLDIERRAKALEGLGAPRSKKDMDDAFNNTLGAASPFINQRGSSISAANLNSPIAGGGSRMLQEREQLKANLDQQMEIITKHYENRKELEIGATEAIELEKQKVLKEMQDNYATLQRHYSIQIAQNIVQTFQNAFDQLTEFARSVAGEQSGIYKAMFLMSRAAAAAMAVVNAFVAYTNALAFIPPPYNVPIAKFALASGLAASAAILGTAIASFEGGGSIAAGPRVGGLDGRGGKLAVVHPSEKILDGEGSSSGGTVAINVNISNYTDATVTASKRDDGSLDIIIKRTSQQIASDVREGRGPVPGAFQDTYKVRRAGR